MVTSPGITFEQAKNATRFVVDDTLNGRKIGTDRHAIVRTAGDTFRCASRLVVFGTAERFVSVAVHSYLDVSISDSSAVELAEDYLSEVSDNVPPVLCVL